MVKQTSENRLRVEVYAGQMPSVVVSDGTGVVIALEFYDGKVFCGRMSDRADIALHTPLKARDEDNPPVEMGLLPKELWKFQRYPGGVIAAGIFDNSGIVGFDVPCRFWVKLPESAFPNDLVSLEDLERFMVEGLDVAAVR